MNEGCYGVDQSSRLIGLAKRRLPEFESNFDVGNAWDREPPQRARSVYTLYDCVPLNYLSEYLRRLHERFISEGGRLIVGAYGSRSRRIPAFDVAEALSSAGLVVAARQQPAIFLSQSSPGQMRDLKCPQGRASFMEWRKVTRERRPKESVAALYMLYHLPDPVRAIAESHRVLRQGGIFVAATPSRHDDPELETVLPRPARMTFDAESGPALVEGIFANVEVEPWDVPGVHLPDRDALALYLYHHNALPRGEARRAAMDVSTPLTLTKRGALIWAHKGP